MVLFAVNGQGKSMFHHVKKAAVGTVHVGQATGCNFVFACQHTQHWSWMTPFLADKRAL